MIQSIQDLSGQIELDKFGNWWHEGTKFSKKSLIQLFNKSINFNKEQNNYFLQIGHNKALFKYFLTPLFITEIDYQQNIIYLNTQTKLNVSSVNFYFSRNLNEIIVKFTDISDADILHIARFTPSQYQIFSAKISGEQEIKFSNFFKPITSID
jgi:hypothetical protein